MSKKKLKEGVDFYFNVDGLMVLTEQYHLNRGKCCESSCKHCPFGFQRNSGKQYKPKK